jgi:hypothetical protein
MIQGMGGLWVHGLFMAGIMMGKGDPAEKARSVIGQTFLLFATLPMGPAAQVFWQFAVTAGPMLPAVAKGLVAGYRGALEARTSLAVPFSHSTVAMDQAFAAAQYAQTSMQGAYSIIGSEAGFMAARYMSRG